MMAYMQLGDSSSSFSMFLNARAQGGPLDCALLFPECSDGLWYCEGAQDERKFRLWIFRRARNISIVGLKTLPKAQRTRGLSSANQSNLFRSYHKMNTQILIKFIWGISTKHQIQNLNQTSASRLILKFKISTKIQLHNLYKTSATK